MCANHDIYFSSPYLKTKELSILSSESTYFVHTLATFQKNPRTTLPLATIILKTNATTFFSICRSNRHVIGHRHFYNIITSTTYTGKSILILDIEPVNDGF